MGINLAWDDDEKTILRHTYAGAWTPEDLRRAVDESRRLLLEVGHPVDLIIDMRTSANPPPGILPVYRYAEQQIPPNQRLVVMVQVGEMMKTFNWVIASIAPMISGQRYLVNSMEEARELIAEHRRGLEAKKP